MKIIDFNKYIIKREKNEMCQNVINEVIQNTEKNKIYLTSDMEDISKKILNETNNNNIIIIPIVEIAKQMQFQIFQKTLIYYLSGFMGIHKRYMKHYKTDHIICTNIKVHPYQQRFVIAHELAHFLFDYNHKDKVYYNTYKKNDHKTESERRANTFAANLLMPKDIFLQKYSEAIKIDPDPIFVMVYLSDLFKAPRKAVLKRLAEVGCYINGKYI